MQHHEGGSDENGRIDQLDQCMGRGHVHTAPLLGALADVGLLEFPDKADQKPGQYRNDQNIAQRIDCLENFRFSPAGNDIGSKQDSDHPDQHLQGFANGIDECIVPRIRRALDIFFQPAQEQAYKRVEQEDGKHDDKHLDHPGG